MHVRDYKNAAERRKALEAFLHISLPHIGSFTLSEEMAATRHTENMVGATQIPLGVAGPLPLHIENREEEYMLPLATTEGALVASVNRGVKAIRDSGGATVSAFGFGATRGIVFHIDGVREGEAFAQFVYTNKAQLNTVAQQTSHHIALMEVTVKTVGRFVFVRLSFDTQDAMGMNMVTIAAEAIAQEITKKTHARLIAIAGNYDVDKKPSWLNFIRGRGWEVRADIVLSEEVLRNVLKTTAKDMYEVWLAKCMVGSALSGSMGFNAHYANIIAALFLATGQDPAHVVEGSLGITTAEIQGNDLYISVYLPDVMLGTVGGGTELATQQEALYILGIVGGNSGKNAKEFAGIVGGTVLAGEVSLLASLASNTLACAHKTLARKKL